MSSFWIVLIIIVAIPTLSFTMAVIRVIFENFLEKKKKNKIVKNNKEQ